MLVFVSEWGALLKKWLIAEELACSSRHQKVTPDS